MPSFDPPPELIGFSGRAPLFPLPNAAFFPQVLLPLHIFEPRYRQMTADVLDGERLIAMATLRPGWEARPDSEPAPIYEQVCLGRISANEKLDDGRYYIVLQGLSRARVVSEEVNDVPYRVAQLELRPERFTANPTIDRQNRRREIMAAFHDLHPKLQFEKLLHEAVEMTGSLGLVCDVVAASLQLPPERAQEILAEEDIDLRSDLVLMRLRELRRKSQGPPRQPNFPPDFSAN
ncbi:MAG: LON peptidase substrate-binding domain-containing protein [Planctomycetaceae bacterium]|nr:LON peptidase substrate-binding domain-containing protein [Planctomycetaceae bacterium]